jgi:hypothetical protein
VWDDLNARFFAEQIQASRISEDAAMLVSKICENVSYSKEVKRIKAVSSPFHFNCPFLIYESFAISRARKRHGITSASSCIAYKTPINWMLWAVGDFLMPLTSEARTQLTTIVPGIGILRCAAFSAAKKRPLLEQGNPDDSISHFHDKLLKLKDMMRTKQGQQAAEARHQTMLVFLDGIQSESSQFKLH